MPMASCCPTTTSQVGWDAGTGLAVMSSFCCRRSGFHMSNHWVCWLISSLFFLVLAAEVHRGVIEVFARGVEVH